MQPDLDTLAVVGLFGALGHGPIKDHRKMKDAFEMSGAVCGGAGVPDSTTAKRPRHHFRHSEITCDMVVCLDLQMHAKGWIRWLVVSATSCKSEKESFSVGFFGCSLSSIVSRMPCRNYVTSGAES